MKKCNGPCGRVLEDQKFYQKKYKNGKVGLRAYCIECGTNSRNEWRKKYWGHDNERNKSYNKRNADRIRGKKLQKNYWPQMTWQEALDEWSGLYKEQGGRCALGHEVKRLHVDHDHKTGKVRGLLCYNCNNGIGRLKDSIDLLQKAIVYLSKE